MYRLDEMRPAAAGKPAAGAALRMAKRYAQRIASERSEAILIVRMLFSAANLSILTTAGCYYHGVLLVLSWRSLSGLNLRLLQRGCTGVVFSWCYPGVLCPG